MIREERIRIPFQYAAGEVGSRFLVALRDEERILASRCEQCATTACPARSICPRCGARTGDLVEVGPRGRLAGFTRMATGEAFGLVRLDGADTSILHRLLAGTGEVAIGDSVRARFARERAASFLDIDGFEPTGEG